MSNKEEIEEIKEQIEKLEQEIKDLEAGENYEEYENALDEQGDIHIGNLTYTPSAVLKEVDPIAYNCGLNDYNDARITDIEEEIDQLKDDIKNLEE